MPVTVSAERAPAVKASTSRARLTNSADNAFESSGRRAPNCVASLRISSLSTAIALPNFSASAVIFASASEPAPNVVVASVITCLASLASSIPCFKNVTPCLSTKAEAAAPAAAAAPLSLEDMPSICVLASLIPEVSFWV